MFTEVQIHNVGEKAESMLITRKIPKLRVRRHAFVTRNTPKKTRSLHSDQVDKEMSKIQNSINNAYKPALDTFMPLPMS